VSRDVTAFHVQWQQSSETPVYLDGRPHPPDYAPYSSTLELLAADLAMAGCATTGCDLCSVD
jgi:hypothetical protein